MTTWVKMFIQINNDERGVQHSCVSQINKEEEEEQTTHFKKYFLSFMFIAIDLSMMRMHQA